MLRKPGIASDRSGNGGLDLAPGLLDGLTGVAAQAAVQLARARDGAWPIAAVDDADIEIDGVLDIGERRVRPLVESGVQLLQGLHDRDGLGDGIHALPGLHRVP